VGKVAIGVLAFAAGALLGGAFVAWYVDRHYLELAGEKLGDKLFGAGTTGAKLTEGVFSLADDVRAAA